MTGSTIPPGALNTHSLARNLGVDDKTADPLPDDSDRYRTGSRVAGSQAGQRSIAQGRETLPRQSIEIGGRGKGRRQLRGATGDAFVVKDDILTGHGMTIPLYRFGFLY